MDDNTCYLVPNLKNVNMRDKENIFGFKVKINCIFFFKFEVKVFFCPLRILITEKNRKKKHTFLAIFLINICLFHFSNSVRGRLGSLLMLCANSGFLFGFLAGYYLTYFTIPYFGIILSIVYLVSFTFFPETPSFLLRCKKEEVMRNFSVSVIT